MAPPATKKAETQPQPVVGGVQTTDSYQQQLQQQQQFQQQLQQQQQRMQLLQQQQQFMQSTATAQATASQVAVTTTPTTAQPSATTAITTAAASESAPTTTAAAASTPAAIAAAAAAVLTAAAEASHSAAARPAILTAAEASAAAAAAVDVVSSDALLLQLAAGEDEDDTPQRGTWNEVEDNILRAAVTSYNGKNWGKIAEHLPGRTPVQCLSHWKNVLNSRVVKGKGSWTPEEDEKLKEIVIKFGPKNWSSVIAPHLPSRMGKQCRERWHNHLNPSLKKTPWSEQEEQVAAKAHDDLGNKWADIAKQLPGRSDNEVKNHWYASLRRRKTRMGQMAGDDDGGANPDEEGNGAASAAGKRKAGPKRTQSAAASRAAAGGSKMKRTRTGPASETRVSAVGTAAAVAAAAVAAASAIANTQLGGLKTLATTGKQTPEQVVAQAQAQQLLLAQELQKRDLGADAADASLLASGVGVDGDEGDERDGRYLGRWSAQEGATLLSLVDKFGPKNWAFIAAHLPGRTDIQCLQHWRHVLNPNVVKGRGSWTPDEDVKLKELVDKYGPKKWASAIAIHLPGRMGKQCRERWHNTLNPGLTRAPWTIEEEMVLATTHKDHGNKWAVISKVLPGRSDNDVKNHFYASLRRKKTKIALAREENQGGADNEAEVVGVGAGGGAGAEASAELSVAAVTAAARQAAAQATLAATRIASAAAAVPSPTPVSTRSSGQPYDVAAAAQAAAAQVGQMTPAQQQQNQQQFMQMQLQQQIVGQQAGQPQYIMPAQMQAQQAAAQAAQLAQAHAQAELSRRA